MPTQTVTRAAESDLEPRKLYKFLADAGNIPKWAPVFADAIEHINETHYRVTKRVKPSNSKSSYTSRPVPSTIFEKCPTASVAEHTSA